MPLAGKRNARKEKLVKCALAPRRPPNHPPRDGSINLAEDPSVPEGKAKSKQAPIRRPPYSNFAHTCKVATKSGLSFWAVQSRSRRRLRRLTDAAYPLRVRPVFFSARRKRKWGHIGASRQRGWIPASNGTHPVGGRLPPLRRHRDVPINIPDGSAVPRGVCCSPGYGHSRPPRRSPSERGHASGFCR